MHRPLEPHREPLIRRTTVIASGLGLALLLAIGLSVVIVDQTEVVYITEFGRPVRLIREPGLHWKWPYQSRRGFDNRVQLDTPPPREMLTRDKKNLEIAWLVNWRIADVERFLRSVRTMPDASARLEDLVASVLAAQIGGHELTGLVRVDEPSQLDAMMAEVAARVDDQAAREYGLKVVDVRIRRLNYPEDVRAAVFEQIRSERKRVAAKTRAEGESHARTIRSAADRERAKMVADAEADAARIVGEGEAEAIRIANAAHGADPDFYRFLKTLETYRAALDGRTTLVLSAESAFLRLLSEGVPDRKGAPSIARTANPAARPAAPPALTSGGGAP
jgi:modulator of FtsH protease HflC